ncbi:MAG: hypothetical protein BV456_09235 [Thermoplasmata archaeon M8B2D]|nr:MAG: hypothetical protein BV456_09235 [Thermoplasmata archaeon M8B2D]
MKKIIRNLFCVAVITVLFLSTNSTALKTTQEKNNLDNQFTNTNFLYNKTEDLDPLVDLDITITIKEIRAFDRIDLFSDPDFYVKLIVNGQSYSSNVWHDQKVVYDQWQETIDVPDDEEFVNITIQLWDWNIGIDTLCDIAKNDNGNPDRYDITVYYSLKTGHWFGDDSNEGAMIVTKGHILGSLIIAVMDVQTVVMIIVYMKTIKIVRYGLILPKMIMMVMVYLIGLR